MTDIEDDAQDGVVMSRADAVRDYGRSLAVSDRGRDETLQNPCPPPLSTVTCSSTAPYMGSGAGSSSGGMSTSTGGASTSTGGFWAERRRDRIQSNKDLIRAMLDFDDEDDEGEVRREFEGMEELERVEEDEEDEDEVRPGCRGRRRNRFLDDECGVSKRGREEDD